MDGGLHRQTRPFWWTLVSTPSKGRKWLLGFKHLSTVVRAILTTDVCSSNANPTAMLLQDSEGCIKRFDQGAAAGNGISRPSWHGDEADKPVAAAAAAGRVAMKCALRPGAAVFTAAGLLQKVHLQPLAKLVLRIIACRAQGNPGVQRQHIGLQPQQHFWLVQQQS